MKADEYQIVTADGHVYTMTVTVGLVHWEKVVVFATWPFSQCSVRCTVLLVIHMCMTCYTSMSSEIHCFFISQPLQVPLHGTQRQTQILMYSTLHRTNMLLIPNTLHCNYIVTWHYIHYHTDQCPSSHYYSMHAYYLNKILWILLIICTQWINIPIIECSGDAVNILHSSCK